MTTSSKQQRKRGSLPRRVRRPRAGDTWRFPMEHVGADGKARRVWWTRKLTWVQPEGVEKPGMAWAGWHEPKSHLRDQTLITIIQQGRCIRAANGGGQQPAARKETQNGN